MKNLPFFTAFLVVLISMTGTKALAHDIQVKNEEGVPIYYVWTNGKTELAVSYSGDNYTSVQNEYSGNIVIPASVVYSGKTFPVTSIRTSAFCECSKVKSVFIPSSVKRIESVAFQYCSGLTDVTISQGVEYIEQEAFSGCSSLTSVTIPSSVTTIGNYPFMNCSSLGSIKVESGNQKYDSRDNCNAIIEKSSNKLIAGCMNTIIPNSVLSIGTYAFAGCSGLLHISFPQKVSRIEEYAFRNCKNLIEVLCYSTTVPSASSNSFPNPSNATLFVPSSSVAAYQSKEPWSNFKAFETFSSSTSQPTERCSKPTIFISGGKIYFSSKTSGVGYHWIVSGPDGSVASGNSNSISLPLTLRVYAKKYGYLNSEIASYVLFSGLPGDVDGNGVVNVGDHVELSKIIMMLE